MRIKGVMAHRVADRLDALCDLLRPETTYQQRAVMQAAVLYIRFLEEQLIEAEQTRPEPPSRPRGRPRAEPADVVTPLTKQTVIPGQTGMTVRRITFR